MTYAKWDLSESVGGTPPSSGQSPTPSNGNGGSHGDLRERVRALEVSQGHLSQYVYDRMRAHHDRLIEGDKMVGRLSAEAAERERRVQSNSEAITAVTSTYNDLRQQVAEMRSVSAASTMATEHRREARRDIMRLILWAGLILVVIGALTGHIPKERLEALQHLKMLPGL